MIWFKLNKFNYFYGFIRFKNRNAPAMAESVALGLSAARNGAINPYPWSVILFSGPFTLGQSDFKNFWQKTPHYCHTSNNPLPRNDTGDMVWQNTPP